MSSKTKLTEEQVRTCIENIVESMKMDEYDFNQERSCIKRYIRDRYFDVHEPREFSLGKLYGIIDKVLNERCPKCHDSEVNSKIRISNEVLKYYVKEILKDNNDEEVPDADYLSPIDLEEYTNTCIKKFREQHPNLYCEENILRKAFYDEIMGNTNNEAQSEDIYYNKLISLNEEDYEALNELEAKREHLENELNEVKKKLNNLKQIVNSRSNVINSIEAYKRAMKVHVNDLLHDADPIELESDSHDN